MFDLSKFMIGSGSDGEHESGESSPIQRLKKGPSDTSNFQFQGQESSPGPEQDSDWSDGEDASGVVKHHRKTEKMEREHAKLVALPTAPPRLSTGPCFEV